MSDQDVIHFSTLLPDGTLIRERTISRATILACPRVILLPEHYREDGTCRCDEPICEVPECGTRKAEDEIFCAAHAEGMGR